MGAGACLRLPAAGRGGQVGARGWSGSHGSPKVGAPEAPCFAGTAWGKKAEASACFPLRGNPEGPASAAL